MENILKKYNIIMILKGGLNVINFAWYFITIICLFKQHTFLNPPHENNILHTPLKA
jgi:hypothetical protein